MLNDSKLKDLCWDHYVKYVYGVLIAILFALVVAMVNFILKYIL